jgi:hypothetical protein
MVVAMGINRDRIRGVRTEQCQVLGVLADRFRQARAAQMLIQAQYLIGF